MILWTPMKIVNFFISPSDSQLKMGDFLPKSMFFDEIWVKNRLFSLVFNKNALYLQLS